MKIKIYNLIKMKQLILLIFLTAFILIKSQSISKSGTTAAKFLNIDVGSRNIAMGSSSVSLVNDATSMYWNPSGITKIDNSGVSFNHTNWILDINSNYLGYAFNLANIVNIGVSAKFVTMDDMEKTTIERPDGTGELFSASSYAIGLTVAKALTENFSIGLTTKYINENIYNSSANGFALDLGVLYDTQLNGLQIGMSITNFGTKMSMTGRDLLVQHDISDPIAGNNPNINADLKTDEFELPLLFRFGVSMDVLKGLANSNLFLSADALHPNDDFESLNLGLEYVFDDLVFIRAGYKSLFLDDAQEDFSFGLGLKFEVPSIGDVRLYYAFQNMKYLNQLHHYTLSFEF